MQDSDLLDHVKQINNTLRVQAYDILQKSLDLECDENIQIHRAADAAIDNFNIIDDKIRQAEERINSVQNIRIEAS